MMAVLIYKDGFHIQTITHTHNNNNTVAYWSRLASNVLCKKGVCVCTVGSLLTPKPEL